MRDALAAQYRAHLLSMARIVRHLASTSDDARLAGFLDAALERSREYGELMPDLDACLNEATSRMPNTLDDTPTNRVNTERPARL